MLKIKSRGFTLVELLIAVVIIAILGIIVVGFVSGTKVDNNTARDEATQWASELGLEVKGISCSNIDTDNDGYVSCTVAEKNGNIVPVECASAISFNSGCRTPKMRSFWDNR